MMKLRTAFVVLSSIVGLVACEDDFGSDVRFHPGDNNDPGTFTAESPLLAPGTAHRIDVSFGAPAVGELYDAKTDNANVVDVRSVSIDEVILDAGDVGDAVITLETSEGDVTVNSRVREPQGIDVFPQPPWITVSGEPFEVDYDLVWDDEHLQGAGYEAIASSSPGLQATEEPLELPPSNVDSRSLIFEVSRPGEYEVETVFGERFTVRRISSEDVESMVLEASGEPVELLGGDTRETIRAYGLYEDRRVFGFSDFRAVSFTPHMCRVDYESTSDEYRAEVVVWRTGECAIGVRHDDAGLFEMKVLRVIDP